MRIYIAGKITGCKEARKIFKEAEVIILNQGNTPLNPMKNIGFNYKDYITMGIVELSMCDAIYMLKGWEESKGAVLEHHYANVVGLDVIYQDEYEV